MNKEQIKALRKVFRDNFLPGTLKIDGSVWDSHGKLIWIGEEHKYSAHNLKTTVNKQSGLFLFPVAEGYLYQFSFIAGQTKKQTTYKIQCVKNTLTKIVNSKRYYYKTEFALKQEEPAIATN